MVTDPVLSLPEVQKTLAWFSDISYYKINKTKSYILNLDVNKSSSDRLKLQFPYTWGDNSITYLGIQLTILSKYIWQGKKSRCGHNKLIKQHLAGGNGYVDFQDYYMSSVLTQSKEWF